MISCRSLPKTQLLLVLTAFLVGISASGQSAFTLENFDKEILKYEPIKRSTITEKDFNFASMVIRETKQAIEGDPDGLNRGDYFNVLVAFLSLDESEQNIQLAFDKFSNSEGACEYFTNDKFKKSVVENEVYAPIRAQFNVRAAECAKTAQPEEPFDLATYCSENKLNQSLVELIQSVDFNDQQYRGDEYELHIEEQKALDKENQVTIDSLHEVHGVYIGESLVGPKFESTMWAVIQHSNPRMMEKYLPVLKRAAQDEELAVAALKMTIDRYYALEYRYQIFGSQGGDLGVKLADQATRERVMKEYGIQ